MARPADECAQLREALEAAEQRFEVALAIVDVLSDHVEDYDGQRLVIAEVVRGWRSLDAAAQRAHAQAGSSFSALTWFAWTWVDHMNATPFASLAEGAFPPEEDAEAMVERHWQDLVEQLAARERPTTADVSSTR